MATKAKAKSIGKQGSTHGRSAKAPMVGIRAIGGLSRALLQGASLPLGASMGLIAGAFGAPAHAQETAPVTAPEAAGSEPAAPPPASAEANPASPVAQPEATPAKAPAAPSAPAAGNPRLVKAAMNQAGAPASDGSVSGTAKEEPALTLPTVKVEGKGAVYNAPESRVSRVAKPLVDTPQTVAVVPKEVLQEQRATSVRDAIRNVSGITASVGEGGRQGDTFIIRGFSAQNDMFRDGARDLGWFTRDTFNLEGVEVFFGPSSVLFGRGSTGGAINLVTKSAKRGTFAEVTLSGGSAPSGRIEADVNDALTDNVQVRANAMVQSGKVVGRDTVETNRAGFAPSMRFRLAERTVLNLDYLYQRERGIPDYGQPFVDGRPVSKGYGVSRTIFYGTPADKENVDAHVTTGRFEQGFGESVKLINTFRLGSVDRFSTPTAVGGLAPSANPVTVSRNRFESKIENLNVINQTDVRFAFDTGPVKHAANLGLELSWERRKQTRHALEMPGMSVNLQGDIRNPNPNPDLSNVRTVFSSYQRGKMTTAGAYLSDQISFFDVVEILGSIRLDSFATDHRSFGADGVVLELDKDDTLFNWRTGLVVHPVAKTSLYAMVGSSVNPSAEGGTLSAGTVTLEPEKNRNYEVGAKAELYDQKLNLGAAVFRVEKENARVPGADPMGPAMVLAGKQKVEGLNLGGAGTVVGTWRVIGSYTLMRSKVESHTNPFVIGQALPNAPEQSLSLWTTVSIADKLTLGGGTVYQADTVVNNPANAMTALNKVPSFWRFDAFASYSATRSVDLQLNVANATNALYYEQYAGSRAVPSEGRVVLVSAKMRL